MEFIYTVDPNSETPIMLINKHIGFDSELGMGVNGEQFMSEMLALDAMGKSLINVWINSTGGGVLAGSNIVSAILNTKCKVDTYNMGVCASIAAVIFQVGRKRIMCDYSKLMYHNTSGSDSSDVIKNMNDLVATIVAVRSDTQIESIKKMMDRTTWISAKEALDNNLCDEIKSSSESNRGRLSKVSNDAQSIWKEANLILNSAITTNKTPHKMNELAKVNNRLGLIETSTEEFALKAIDKIENKLTEAENKVVDLESVVNKLKGENAELKGTVEAAEKKANAARAEAESALALETVQNFVKLGKVANKPETIQNWVNMASKVGIESVKAMLEDLPVNKVGADIDTAKPQVDASKFDPKTNMAVLMGEIRNKLELN